MFWTIVVWLLKGLVVLWVLQLAVFAVGFSIASKVSRSSVRDAADRTAEDDVIADVGLESPVSKPAT
ncbi:MAG: hypothetical protein H0U00_07030 [Actinobacteria bacterium]|nr:hypothetical protein [Actinomycetota bacterium]